LLSIHLLVQQVIHAVRLVAETHSGFPSPSVSPASQASSDIDGHAAAPSVVKAQCIDLLDSSGRIRSLNSYSPFANAPGPQMSGTLRPLPRSVSWPNLPPMDDSDQESTQDTSRRSADEGSRSGNAAGSRRAQAQSLPADAIMSSALYALRQDPQQRPPSQPSDVPTLQKTSSFSRRASLAAMLLKMRAGDDLSRNSSQSSGAASLMSSVNSADHLHRAGGPSATPRSSTGQGQPMPLSVGGKGHQQGAKFADDRASRKEKTRLSSELIDRMAADVRLQRFRGGSAVSTPQNSGHSKHGGVSISRDAGGDDSLSSDDSASNQAL